MVNSKSTPHWGRKEEKHECSRYVDELIGTMDILETAVAFRLRVNEEGCAVCWDHHEGCSTLRIDQATQTFRCSHPLCNDHRDVITLTQRLLRMPFEAAVNVLCSGKAFGRWIAEHPQEAHCYGRVRDCMSYAARMFAMRLDLVTHYLTSRGVSEETAQRCMIGGAVGDKNVKKALYDKGFDSQTIRLSGLLNPYGKDRFQQHVVVPIFRNGQVVDFYGRIRNKEAEEQGKHRRLPADRFILGQSLFNWDPRRSDIIWVEGVFDALSLIEHGFRNAVAAYGTNGINMDLLTDSSVKKVWMCFDGDGSGRESNLKRAYDLKDAGLDVRIVDLPDGQDPNEFFLERSAADFQDLVRSATHPEVWEIEHLDAELDEHEQIMALENVMRRAGTMGPMHRAALIKRISKKLAIREKDVREQIESMSAQSANITASRGGNVTDLSTYELVHPALHFGPKGTLVTIPMMVTDQHTGRRDWEPWVMTSERESFPLTHEELNRRGYYCAGIVTPGRQRYSQQVITEYLAGSRSGDLPGTFNSIRAIFQRYLDFSDPRTHDYLTAWTIGTYFFPIFNYYPYIHFTGTKEVGKSKAMKLMSQLCFNGIMSVSITDASQFRIITELLPTLFLDETENLSDRNYSERRALLLGGYEKGSTAIRTEKVGDGFRAREYDNYSPRVFGSIDGLEDTLASRTVQIPMRRSYDENIKSTEVQLADPLFEEIRDELFLVAMDYGHAVRNVYEQLQRPVEAEFDAREWNLFKPILAIGVTVGDPMVISTLIAFGNNAYRAKTDALNDSAVENVVLRCLSELVQQEDWFELDQIHRHAVDFIKQQGLNVGALSKDRLGKLVHDLDLVEQKDRRMTLGKKITVYLIRPEKIQQVAQNYRVT